MTDKNRMDEINKKNVNNAQLVEDAKERLRWYTSEASGEEFDGDAVAALVNLIATLDESYSVEEEDEEQLKAQFKAYCNLYEEEEKLRKTLKSYKGSESVAVKKNSGRITSFGKKGMTVAAVACILLVIIAGSTLGIVNAGEDGGFFHWLKKDKEGTLAVTSPENVGVSVEENYPDVYSDFEDVPEEYQQYLVKKEEIGLLEAYEFERVECVKLNSVQRIREIFVSGDEKKEIQIGILVYEDLTMVARDKFVDYKFLYSNLLEEKQQDVYVKEEKDGKLIYLVSFYQNNKKYFVSGIEDVNFLEKLSEEYMGIIY